MSEEMVEGLHVTFQTRGSDAGRVLLVWIQFTENSREAICCQGGDINNGQRMSVMQQYCSRMSFLLIVCNISCFSKHRRLRVTAS